MYTYKTHGVCAREINLEVEGDTIKHVDFVGGCNGNLKALSKLVEGRSVEEMAALLEGNTCGKRTTSCADQMIQGLRAAQNQS